MQMRRVLERPLKITPEGDKEQVGRVAAYGPEDLEGLFEDKNTARNRRKTVATVENARTMLDLIDEHESFHAYLRTLDHLDYYSRVKALTRLFSGAGRTSAFAFLHCVDEETPEWQDR